MVLDNWRRRIVLIVLVDCSEPAVHGKPCRTARHLGPRPVDRKRALLLWRLSYISGLRTEGFIVIQL